MKTKIIVVSLFFSLTLNIAALAAFLCSRTGACGATDKNFSARVNEQLKLTPQQRQRFAELDAGYSAERNHCARRLRELRRSLLDRVIDNQQAEALEQVLKQITAEQVFLQRALLDNLRAKVALLDQKQKEVYRELLERLAMGCGCVGCSGPCQQ